MHVLKFGGTSVGTTASLLNVKKIVESIDGPAIVVVSALGGLTDKLIATARLAAEGEDFAVEMQEIAERHYRIIDDVVSPEQKERIREKVAFLLSELERNYLGVSYLRSVPEETLDVIVSFGERMSSVIVSGMIRGARHHDSTDFVKTEKWFGKNIADRKLTDELILEEFTKNEAGTEIVGGFISKDRDSGKITNLGRGGSDYTAALIAAALGAEMLDIWTDVDGFMTADPRIVPTARVVPEMSFVESMALCSFGAKVIYPPTIYPVFHKGIPIRILNTFNPQAPGTFISDKSVLSPFPIKGISALKDINIVTMCGEIARNGGAISSRTYSALSRRGISLYQMNRNIRPNAFTFALAKADAANAVKSLEEEFAPELLNSELESVVLTEGLASLAIVGDDIRSHVHLFREIETALTEAGIEIMGASDGNSETTMNFVIPADKVNLALGVCHELVYDSGLRI